MKARKHVLHWRYKHIGSEESRALGGGTGVPMWRPFTTTFLVISLLPMVSSEAPTTFEAAAGCVLAQTLPASGGCSAAHSGTVGEPYCGWSESWQLDWCGIPWSINATFSGPEGIMKRIWVRQSWETWGGATDWCAGDWSTASVVHCDHSSPGGALAPILPGECDVMRLTTKGDMPPPLWVEYRMYPTWHAEAVTRIELCRDADGIPAIRLLE